MGYLHQGRIIWRAVPNLHGDGEKVRPLIIVSSTAAANDRKIDTLECVACSHSTAERDPLPPRCVLLPPKTGKRETKLHRATVAVCDWLVEVPKQTIDDRDLAGSIGESVLAEVLRFVAEHRTGKNPTADPSP